MDFKGSHIISISDFSKKDILKVLRTAKKIEENPRKCLIGKRMATLFFEPSTRTRLSFESAMLKLGGSILGFAKGSVSSQEKGESVQDTIRMIEQYADVAVIRHFLDGAPRAAGDVSKIPIINGGDGGNQHPTQALLDLYSILKTQKTLQKLKIAFVGDLKYGRTVHSLANGLSLFDAELIFVAPQDLQLPKSIREELDKKNIQCSVEEKITDVIGKVDILYMTRIQKERFPDLNEYERVKDVFILKKSMLKYAKDNMKIMHPLPRVNEISTDVDSTKYAYYFEQAGNGIPVRGALLCLVLGVEI